MIIRQFLLLTQDPSAGRRAEAASALARAYLYGTLGAETAWETKTALLAMLDDPSPLVRRALAEACGHAPSAPRPLIVSLASDDPEIACLVLASSPVLMDADLVDCAAIGCERARVAIAGRAGLSRPVAAALAEVAGPDALIALAHNDDARIGTAAFMRIIERHGDDGRLREALFVRDDLAIEARQTLAARTAESLAQYGHVNGRISPERGARMVREARECATLSLSDEAGEAGLSRLVAHLRVRGELNAGLILRGLLSRRMTFVEAALADLAGLSRARVAGLLLSPRGAGFAALHRKTGLPALLLSPMQAALCAWREATAGGETVTGARLSRRMIESALDACADLPFAEGRSLTALLTRFEAEAAREEARELTQALALDTSAPDLHGGGRTGLIAWSEATASDGSRTELTREEAFPVDAILSELPAAIVASYRAEQVRRDDAAATQVVLDDLSQALVARYLSDERAAPMPAPASSRGGGAKPGRARSVALALAAVMLPMRSVRERLAA